MSLFIILLVCIVPALLTFYGIVRQYTLRHRAGDLGEEWNANSIFCFGVLMAALWPLTMLWALARRSTREERKLNVQRRMNRLIIETERRAQELGVGD